MAAEGQTVSLRFRLFKYTVYGLLAVNIVLFLAFGSLHEAFDSLGWVLLLGAFEYETAALDQDYASAVEKYGLWAVQIVGYALAIFAAWQYFAAEEWVDLANAVAWLLVCAAIAYDVHVPGEYGGLEWRVRNAIKGVLYATLLGLAAWWGYDGIVGTADTHAMLEFYDALLWIVCFAAVELNVFASETVPDSETQRA